MGGRWFESDDSFEKNVDRDRKTTAVLPLCASHLICSGCQSAHFGARGIPRQLGVKQEEQGLRSCRRYTVAYVCLCLFVFGTDRPARTRERGEH